MSPQPGSMVVVLSTLNAKLTTIHRKYTDTLHLYRRYQKSIDAAEYSGYSLGHDPQLLATARRNLRWLSFEYRAYKRAWTLLDKEEGNNDER